MINEEKLLIELNDLGISVEKHMADADKNAEETLGFSYKNQLAMLKNVIRRIRKQPKIGGWIPCSERMPETGIPLLCQWHKRNELDTEVYFSILHVDDDGKWVADYGMPNGEVVAWMPLPDPYNGEEENDV